MVGDGLVGPVVCVLEQEDVPLDLEELERMYLKELMRHEDPLEGLRAVKEKRPPRWKNR